MKKWNWNRLVQIAKSDVKINKWLILTLLFLVVFGVFAENVGGVRTMAANYLWRYGLWKHDAKSARGSLQGTDGPIETRKLLRKAIIENQPEQVRKFLSQGGNPNIIVKQGLPALYWSVLQNHVDVIRILVKSGADLDAKPYHNWCALSVAINKHYNTIANLLLDAGASIEGDPKHLDQSPLWEAVGQGNMAILDRLLKMGVDTAAVREGSMPGDTQSVVGYALYKNQYQATIRLIEETGPSRVADKNVVCEPFLSNGCLAGVQRALTQRYYTGFKRSHSNPIIEAIHKKATDDEMSSLIDQKPDLIDQEDDTGDIPLMTAVDYNQIAVVQKLIEHGCHVNKRDGNGYTAVLLAAEQEHLEIFRALIRAGADLRQPGCHDDSLFTFLIHRQLIKPMKILVEEGINLNISDSMGTPLQVAFAYGRKDFAKMLLEAGADPYLKAGSLPAPVEYIRTESRFAELKGLIKSSEMQKGEQQHWILGDQKQSGAVCLHVITVCRGRNPDAHQESSIPVRVSDKTKPVILLLNGREPIKWQIQTEPGVEIRKVFAVGYRPQRIVGIDKEVPAVTSNEKTHLGLRICEVKSKSQLLDIIEEIQKLTGMRPATVQSEYIGTHFVVDGKKTIDFQQAILNTPPHRPVVLLSGSKGGAKVSGNGLSCKYGGVGAFSTAFAGVRYNAGRWYLEVTINPDRRDSAIGTYTNVGLIGADSEDELFFLPSHSESLYTYAFPKNAAGGLQGGDIIGVAVDLDDARLYFHINGRWIEGTPGKLTSGIRIKQGRDYTVGLSVSSSEHGGSDVLAANFGESPFRYSIPKGYRALGESSKIQDDHSSGY